MVGLSMTGNTLLGIALVYWTVIWRI